METNKETIKKHTGVTVLVCTIIGFILYLLGGYTYKLTHNPKQENRIFYNALYSVVKLDDEHYLVIPETRRQDSISVINLVELDGYVYNPEDTD